MTKHLVAYRTHILRNHITSPLDECVCLCRHGKRDAGTRRCSVRDEVGYGREIVILRSTGRIHDVNDIFLYLLVHIHILHDLACPHDVLRLEHRLSLREAAAVVHADDLALFLLLRISHHDLEHETVELGLRKRIGSLLLDRVLCGHHEEWLRKLECLVADGHLTFLHRLEKSRLYLCRRTVDLVGKDEISEDRTFLDLELLALL